MAVAPDRSLPKQCGAWADLKGAYRFLNNPKVTPEEIQQAHRTQVRERCLKYQVILAVEDTSELDFTAHPSVEGLGPIGNGGGRGLLQHSTLAVAPDSDLIGVLHQIWRTRVPVPEGETRRQRLSRRRESDFWPESVRAVGSLGPQTRLVHVTDRGGDLFETMVACREQANTGFLIRAQHDRWVQGATEKLRSFIGRQPVAGYRDVLVPARPGVPERIARVSIRYARLKLDAPCRDPRFTEPIDAWAIHAVEEEPPADITPIEWILLTSEAVDSFEDACERVDWYCLRWLIEEWHHVEKTGCRLEASQLKTVEALERWAALVAIVAVRLLQLRNLAQTAVGAPPNDPASPANQPAALQALVPPIWLEMVARLAKRPAEALAPREFWLTIAKRGGFIGRKRDGRPGWITIWRGWYDVMIMVQGVELLAEARPKTCG